MKDSCIFAKIKMILNVRVLKKSRFRFVKQSKGDLKIPGICSDSLKNCENPPDLKSQGGVFSCRRKCLKSRRGGGISPSQLGIRISSVHLDGFPYPTFTLLDRTAQQHTQMYAVVLEHECLLGVGG